MKSSTFGLAVAFFLILLGTGVWRLSNWEANQTLASDSGSIILGQTDDIVPGPPARLAQGADRRANPLRSADPLPSPIRPVSDVQELQHELQPLEESSREYTQLSTPQLVPSQSAIATASFPPAQPHAGQSHVGQSDFLPGPYAHGAVPRNDLSSQRRLSGFENVPNSTGSPQDNFMESAGFPDAAPLAPQPLPSPFDPGLPAEGSAGGESVVGFKIQAEDPIPQSLGNADPFGNAAFGGTAPKSSFAVPSSPREPVASNHNTPHYEIERNKRPMDGRSTGNSPLESSRSTSSSGDVSEGDGTPGPIALEGAQTPHLTIEKVIPEEIVVQQAATIKTVVKNVGRSTAKNIRVSDNVPQGTRLLSTAPEAMSAADGSLSWNLGNLDAGEQQMIEMRVLPLRECEIGSVATLHYSAEVSVRKTVTRPQIEVEVKAPKEIQSGQIANIEIIISNPGTATATGIVLEEHVPDGLYHKDGKILVNKNVDTLKPREAKKLTLPLTCTGSGTLVNKIIVTANAGLRAEAETTIRALSPMLELNITGTKQRFLERKSKYNLVVSNGGTASAQNVDLVLTLPTAVQFVSTNQSGVYEPATHTVHWALEELPPRESGEIELVLLPGKIGNYTLKFSGVGENNLKAEKTHPMVIDGLAALSFEVVGQSLVEIGKETTYEIRVANKGTKPATNVKIRATLTDGLSFVNAEGPVRHQSKNGVILFEGLSQLDSKGERTYKIKAKCQADGDHRISVQLLSDELSSPITKEESTQVFQ